MNLRDFISRLLARRSAARFRDTGRAPLATSVPSAVPVGAEEATEHHVRPGDPEPVAYQMPSALPVAIADVPLRDLEVLIRDVPLFAPGPRIGDDPESEANEGYKLLDEMRDAVGGMLLLTATPMQLHDYELYSMVELVEPGLFNGYGDFAASRVEIARINGAVAALRCDNTSTGEIDQCLDLMRDYDAPLEILEAAASGPGGREIGATWLSRRHRLSYALVRNRKTEIGGFRPRRAHRVEVFPGAEELELDRDVQAYIRQRFASASGKRSAVGLVLVAFQKMHCSSSKALAAALETRASRLIGETEPVEALSDDPDFSKATHDLVSVAAADARSEAAELLALATRARSVQDAKLHALNDLVDRVLEDDPSEKILIFSQFLASIEMIRARLATKHRVGVFHGGMTRDEKDQAHRRFKGTTQVLVSSEAGGEGRNFQFAHIVVNYDLPWNPMKIEQRIGRVDRVGQTRDVEIYNFAVRETLDERILDVLEYRIRIFTETVGALDPILESLEDEIGRIALGDGNVDHAFEELDAELEDRIRQAKALEEARHDFVLDWRSLQRDEAARLLGREPRATREDLERFCRAVIGRFDGFGHGKIEGDGSEVVIHVPGVLGNGAKRVYEDHRGTFDVATALSDETLEFFAMGNPLVEAMIDYVGDPWWLPVSVLESEEWPNLEPALLVDYRLELYGIRDSGRLISQFVTSRGVRPAVTVIEPSTPGLRVRLPDWPSDTVTRLISTGQRAAHREALVEFEKFKAEHISLIEHELARLARMYSSRRVFLDERVARNEREIARLLQLGSAQQQRIIPARRGQIAADQKRIADIEKERAQRVSEVETTMPSHLLRPLAVNAIVPVGFLKELAL